MINPEHKLALTRQAELLEISRSTVYYRPRPISDADLMLMRRIDELHMNYPFAGSRMLRDMLSQQGLEVGRRHVRTLMRRMAIETLYRKPNTSKPTPGNKIYPYLLRGLSVTRPNQVFAMDITYIPMARGFVYLAAVVDWFSRRVLAWRLSITMDTTFCIEALEEALSQHGKPEILNTDQGSQFTSEAFTERLKKEGIQISMDGKGRWADNVFVERLWRSLKYEHVYLHTYESVGEARRWQVIAKGSSGPIADLPAPGCGCTRGSWLHRARLSIRSSRAPRNSAPRSSVSDLHTSAQGISHSCL